jgi:hypothetical protein
MAEPDKSRVAGEAKWPDDGQKRQWWTQGPSGHRAKKPTRQAEPGEEWFSVADVESLGFIGVKKFASEAGLLKEGRYTIPGRSKIKRMNYVDREGLRACILHFRAKQGGVELVQIEKFLEKVGQVKERELKKLRKLMGAA